MLGALLGRDGIGIVMAWLGLDGSGRKARHVEWDLGGLFHANEVMVTLLIML